MCRRVGPCLKGGSSEAILGETYRHNIAGHEQRARIAGRVGFSPSGLGYTHSMAGKIISGFGYRNGVDWKVRALELGLGHESALGPGHDLWLLTRDGVPISETFVSNEGHGMLDLYEKQTAVDAAPPVSATTQAAYERALTAEPQLEAVVKVVDALLLIDDEKGDGLDHWGIIKPLIVPWLGYQRGTVPVNAQDAPTSATPKVKSVGELARTNLPRPVPATTETEKWLRSEEAYDAFTDVLLARLGYSTNG